MNYYDNAVDVHESADGLLGLNKFRMSIYCSCLAVELYLKSKLHLVSHEDELEVSHNIIAIYDALTARFKPKNDLKPMIVRCRKYFNESRYPYVGDIGIYTKEFAEEFIDFTNQVKDFIDNDCMATMDDLLNKYSNR